MEAASESMGGGIVKREKREAFSTVSVTAELPVVCQAIKASRPASGEEKALPVVQPVAKAGCC